MTRSVLFAVLSSGALLVSAALSQDAEYKGLTARELCLRPPKPATPAASNKVPSRTSASRPAPKKPTETAAPAEEAPAVPVVLASQNLSDVPLGMRYKLRKRIENQWEDVSTDEVFHAGDRIRLLVTPYDEGYLYVVQRGSSDRWEVLFPNEAAGDTNNHLRREQTVTKQFYFDQTAGEEKLFLVFSRRPQPDLEQLIHKLSAREKGSPAATPTPAGVEQPKAPAPRRQEPLKVLMAENRPMLDDTFVGRLRSSLAARDLVFEKVEDEKGEEKEKAVYMAVPSRGPDATLTADLTLKHR